MKYTNQTNQVNLSWRFHRQFAEGTVPDRPVKYSRAGKMYRPTSVSVSLSASYVGITPDELTVVALQRYAGLVVSFGEATIHGYNVLKSGGIGQIDHHEKIWRKDELPDWVQTIVDEELLSVLNNR